MIDNFIPKSPKELIIYLIATSFFLFFLHLNWHQLGMKSPRPAGHIKLVEEIFESLEPGKI